MLASFQDIWGHIWENMEIRGHLMAGNWNRLKVCLLTCLVSRLEWLKHWSCCQNIYLWPLCMGWLLWNIEASGQDILHDDSGVYAHVFHQMRQNCTAFYDNLKTHIASLPSTLLVEVVRSPLDSREENRDLPRCGRVAGSYRRGEVGVGDTVVLSLETNTCHSG